MTTGRKKMLLSNDDVHERAQFVKNYIQLKLQNNSKTIERSKEDICWLYNEQSLVYTLFQHTPPNLNRNWSPMAPEKYTKAAIN